MKIHQKDSDFELGIKLLGKCLPSARNLGRLSYLMLVVFLCGVAFPWVFGRAINEILRGELWGVAVLLVMLSLITFGEWVYNCFRLKLVAVLVALTEFRLLSSLTRIVLSGRSGVFLVDNGVVLNSYGHVRLITSFVIQVAPQYLLDIGSAFFALTIIIWVSPECGAIISVALILTLAFASKVYVALCQATENYFKGECIKQKAISDIVCSIRSTHCIGSQRIQQRYLVHALKPYIAALLDVLRQARVLQLSGLLSSRLIMVAVLVCGCVSVNNGVITIGDLFVIQILLPRIIAAVSIAPEILKSAREFSVAIRSLGHLIAHQKVSHFTVAYLPSSLVVSVKQLYTSHPDKSPALLNISLTFPQGGLAVVVGKNGSGKSTLAYSLVAFHCKTFGDIYYSGVNQDSICPKFLRERVLLSEQIPFLFAGTLRENLSGGRAVSEARIFDALSRVGLAVWAASLVAGLDHLIEHRGGNLSGGQRQRITLARALLSDGDVCIFDEPTSALDLEMCKVALKIMQHISKSKLVICITHDPCIMREASWVVLMDNGKVAACGSHEFLLRTNALYLSLSTITDIG